MQSQVIGGGVVGGACVGGVVGPTVTTAVISGIGFTSTGITVGSTAAGMMSSAAIANGGGVTAGSTVAVLQSIGAAGLGPIGTTVASAVGAAAGAAVGLISIGTPYCVYHLCRSGLNDPSYEDKTGYWVVATEEAPLSKGTPHIISYAFPDEASARAAFNRIWCARILYNPEGDEIAVAGLNRFAYPTIRQVITERKVQAKKLQVH